MPGTSRLEVVGMDALGTLMTNNQEPFTLAEPFRERDRGGDFRQIRDDPADRSPAADPHGARYDDQPAQIRCALSCASLARCNNLELYIQPDPFLGTDVGHLHRPLHAFAAAGRAVDRFRQADQPHAVQRVERHVAADGRCWSDGRPDDARALARRPHHSPTSFPWGRSRRSCACSRRRSRGSVPAAPPIPTEAQLHALAQASATSRAITAQGEVDGIKFARPLRVGMPVLVRGAGRQNSGLYYVQSVTHRISRDDYRQSFSAWRNAVGLTGAEVFFDPLAAVA